MSYNKSSASAVTKPEAVTVSAANPGTRDRACHDRNRHMANCECTGAMREPITPAVKKR